MTPGEPSAAKKAAAEPDEPAEDAVEPDEPVTEDPKLAEPAPAGASSLLIETDEHGDGAAMVGLDADNVAIVSAPRDVEVEVTPSQTVSIARVGVSGGPASSTITVVVAPKK